MRLGKASFTKNFKQIIQSPDQTDFYFLAISIFSFTLIREYLAALLPVILIGTILVFRLKVSRSTLILTASAILSFIVSGIIWEFHFVNSIVSMVLTLLPVSLLFMHKQNVEKSEYVERFFIISATVLLIVNATAFIQIIYSRLLDVKNVSDSFIGLYGYSGLKMHTLSLINVLYAAYFYFTKRLLLAGIFCGGFILSFFGFGLLAVVICIFILSLLTKRVKEYMIIFLIIMGGYFLAARVFVPIQNNYLAKNVREGTFGISEYLSGIRTGISEKYEMEMEKARNGELTVIPRKFTFFVGAFERIKKDPLILIAGTGPGTYNSRSSFLFNGVYSKNPLLESLSTQPKFAIQDVYPLWNPGLFKIKFNDGSRNQPFSSLSAVLMEYGLAFLILLVFLMASSIKRIYHHSKHKEFILFTSIFVSLCLIQDNYLEYPELSWIIFLIFWLLRIDSLSTISKSEK